MFKFVVHTDNWYFGCPRVSCVCNVFAPWIVPGTFVKRMVFMTTMPLLYVMNQSYTITNDAWFSLHLFTLSLPWNETAWSVNSNETINLVTGILGALKWVVCNVFASGIEPGSFVKRMVIMNTIPPLHVTNWSYIIINDAWFSLHLFTLSHTIEKTVRYITIFNSGRKTF